MGWVANSWEPRLKFVLFATLFLAAPFTLVYAIINYITTYWRVIAGAVSTFWLAIIALFVLWFTSTAVLHKLYDIYNWDIDRIRIIGFEIFPSLIYSYYAIFIAYPEVHFLFNNSNPTYTTSLSSGNLINIFAAVFVPALLALWVPFLMERRT